jgi:hypothetical protein
MDYPPSPVPPGGIADSGEFRDEHSLRLRVLIALRRSLLLRLMMLKVAVGHSYDPDSQGAIDEVMAQCQATLAADRPQAAILMAAMGFDHGLILHEIQRVFPDIHLIGCTTDGEMSSRHGFRQDSIVLTLFCSDQIEIRAGVGRAVSQDEIAAAHAAIAQARSPDHPPQLCLTLPESLTTSSVSILAGLQGALGESFPIYGGLAADEWKFQHTYQFYGTEILQDAVPVLLFSGTALRFSHGCVSGFQPISKPGRVTKVDRHILYEIDGQPALNFYRSHFGSLEISPEYPLAVFAPEQHQFYLRTFSGYDATLGSITSFGDIPLHATVQIATTNRHDVLLGAKESILTALANYPGTEPTVALLFSCAARRIILGTRTREEIQLVQSCLPTTVTSSGFYTYGEISPLSPLASVQLHQAALITLLLGTH